MRAIGLCLGASNINIVEIEEKDASIKINKVIIRAHEGNPKGFLIEELRKLSLDTNIAVTGRKFRQLVDLSSISEAEAVETAMSYLRNKDNTYNNFDAIASLGGENFMTYVLDKEGKIATMVTGNKCASGTGEFFLQQIRRTNTPLNKAVELAKKGKPYKVAGRCSVFCKSDCTHALNKGESKENVLSGLCQMMANKVIELLDKAKRKENVILVGGVSQNEGMVDFIRKEVPTLRIPEEAPYFEALGAAIWALSNKTKPFLGFDRLIKKDFSSLEFLPQLKNFEPDVSFKSINKSAAKEGDICILGLDVGSTTTKAIIMRREDPAVLASIYLRTNGDPVHASRECYKELLKQIDANIKIIGLGVTGSGRQIAGLHALTDGVINEIIAHAAASVYFDEDVDTIFEIGGQDAKYTYITNGIASDYAMNEACSAGTGSFLEESAKETLGIEMTEIADLALKGKNPPNFNDQCAAFISSDIKNALHEGLEKEDILAGLVYSICMNYTNRVKGNRPVGKKIFMQGGVCYNKAVPIAMAALTKKKIIVPPEPGLMGAFGVALEIKKRQDAKLLKPGSYDLKELAEREIEYEKSFACAGGDDSCDRKCRITTVKIKDKIYPFGGACNKYANIRRNLKYDVSKLDLVILRQKLIFEKYAKLDSQPAEESQGTIGINRSLLVETLYPLYYNFFNQLGLRVVLPDTIDEEGINKKGAAFCYPIEISHGHMQNLLDKNPDTFFLPHVLSMHVENGVKGSCTCPFVQGEPYYLRTAFKELRKRKVITPVLDFSKGLLQVKKKFIEIGKQLGFTKQKTSEAFDFAVEKQNSFQKEIKEIGREVLKKLEEDKSKTAMVVFGRPYNAFSKIANMGIPHKFASRGILTIPLDFLPYSEEENSYNMYWSMGQINLKAARFVKKHPQLFATYITNFSCGPDSFLITYFRDIMGQKPSLTLELDSHSSDVGVNTRIEAALDIMGAYYKLDKHNKSVKEEEFNPARVVSENGKLHVIASDGEKLPLTDKKVKLILPSMGQITSQLIVAALRGYGFSAESVETPTMNVLRHGRANSSCKECLPLQLTVGSLVEFIREKRKPGEVIVYYMPKNESGPCRFGQYHIFIENLIAKERMKDVAVFASSSKEGYSGFPMARTIISVIVGDALEDIRNALKVLPKDKKKAMEIFEEEFKAIISSFEDKNKKPLEQVRKTVKRLNTIPLRYPLSEAKIIALVGEIYVRRDYFSRQNLEDKLAKKDFILKIAPVLEWFHYLVYSLRNNLIDLDLSWKEKMLLHSKAYMLTVVEKYVKRAFKGCKLCSTEPLDINSIIGHAEHLLSPYLGGEAIVTIGSGLMEILSHTCGVISIGPFGCMPSRIAEAILSEEMNIDGKNKASKNKVKIDGVSHLPFLAIETDGNLFPQIIQSKLETFCLQADRLNQKIRKTHKTA